MLTSHRALSPLIQFSFHKDWHLFHSFVVRFKSFECLALMMIRWLTDWLTDLFLFFKHVFDRCFFENSVKILQFYSLKEIDYKTSNFSIQVRNVTDLFYEATGFFLSPARLMFKTRCKRPKNFYLKCVASWKDHPNLENTQKS